MKGTLGGADSTSKGMFVFRDTPTSPEGCHLRQGLGAGTVADLSDVVEN